MRISDWSSDVCSSDLLALSIEPFVLFSRAVGAGLHDEIVAACRVAGFSPRVVQEASQVTSIVNLVASGIGASILPASMLPLHRSAERRLGKECVSTCKCRVAQSH